MSKRKKERERKKEEISCHVFGLEQINMQNRLAPVGTDFGEVVNDSHNEDISRKNQAHTI